ncbi:phosphoglycolate phosphatase [Nocardioides scoriae]|uniref:Phosphoglycolate phosphatase n=1 Tax=Nocardioides scoriae TaxID=642780 RepID=A0A1H1V8H8_9ACTN|nr:phosphoglycolate phosphatase [Nocardioides scoriae]
MVRSGTLLLVSTQPVAAVIWDMDGTLVDSATVVPDAFIETVQRLGGPTLTRDQVVAHYDAGAPHEMIGLMVGREARVEDGELYHRVLADLSHTVRVHDGIAEVLGELGRRGVPLAVFTGNSVEAAGLLLGATGLRDHFDVVVGGNEVARPKPAPDGVLEAASRLGVDAAACVYVGDSPLDVGAARDAGATPVAAGWGHLFDAGAAVTAAATPAELLDLLRDRPVA